MAGWIKIKMPLGMEVGLGPGDIVLDGDPASPTERRTTAPTFRPTFILAKQSSISATAELLLLTEETLLRTGNLEDNSPRLKPFHPIQLKFALS